MNLLRIILLPLVPIYFIVTWLRNFFYDIGWFSSKSYNFPLICVGNLSVGGTGKTPMIEYLIRLLKNDFKVATLSRGYKRKTKGFYIANTTSSFESIGDEPFQFYNKFAPDIQVAVDENRQHGIASLRELEPQPEIILLDDAFQHRKVNAGLNILLTRFDALYHKDFVLPTGNLREPKKGAKRAQIILITKCPVDLNEGEKQKIIDDLKPKHNQAVYFSSIRYLDEVISKRQKKRLDDFNNFTLVTGIANASSLVSYLNEKELKFKHLNYKDHHEFTSKDIEELESKEYILTTEKDYMRLMTYTSLSDKLFYLPIEVVIENSSQFNQQIKEFVS